jgi:predicted metalloprotease
MEWRGRRGSGNIEDRRRSGPARAGGIGLFGLIIVLAVGYFFGIDISPLMSSGGGQVTQGQTRELTAEDKAEGEFVSVTLADTEEIWTKVFRDQLGRNYRPTTLVLFKGATPSPCGGANGATGPFYCPLDQKVYLDTEFFVTMERQLGASGDFAAAYVVAHEVAHHVQNELGILGKVNQVRQQSSQADSNALSVRIELQADCLAGIWAAQVSQQFGSIDRGDVEEAVNAARQIGDDTLMRNAGKRPMPHTFTHGTSQQRSEWLMRGMQTGDLASCDTFAAPSL